MATCSWNTDAIGKVRKHEYLAATRGLAACIMLAICSSGCTSDLDDVEPARSMPVKTDEFEGVYDWHEQEVRVIDGGDCYFRLKYDVEAGTFSDLVVNGSA